MSGVDKVVNQHKVSSVYTAYLLLFCLFFQQLVYAVEPVVLYFRSVHTLQNIEEVHRENESEREFKVRALDANGLSSSDEIARRITWAADSEEVVLEPFLGTDGYSHARISAMDGGNFTVSAQLDGQKKNKHIIFDKQYQLEGDGLQVVGKNVAADGISTLRVSTTVLDRDEMPAQGTEVKWRFVSNTINALLSNESSITDKDGKAFVDITAELDGFVHLIADIEGLTFAAESNNEKRVRFGEVPKNKKTGFESIGVNKDHALGDGKDTIMAVIRVKDEIPDAQRQVEWVLKNNKNNNKKICTQPEAYDLGKTLVCEITQDYAGDATIQVTVSNKDNSKAERKIKKVSFANVYKIKTLSVHDSQKVAGQVKETEANGIDYISVVAQLNYPVKDRTILWHLADNTAAASLSTDKSLTDDEGQTSVKVRASQAGGVAVIAQFVDKLGVEREEPVTFALKNAFKKTYNTGIHNIKTNKIAAKAGGDQGIEASMFVDIGDGYTPAVGETINWSLENNTIKARLVSNQSVTNEQGIATINIFSEAPGEVFIVGELARKSGLTGGDAKQEKRRTKLLFKERTGIKIYGIKRVVPSLDEPAEAHGREAITLTADIINIAGKEDERPVQWSFKENTIGAKFVHNGKKSDTVTIESDREGKSRVQLSAIKPGKVGVIVRTTNSVDAFGVDDDVHTKRRIISVPFQQTFTVDSVRSNLDQGVDAEAADDVTVTLTAEIFDVDKQKASGQEVTWSLADNSAQAVFVDSKRADPITRLSQQGESIVQIRGKRNGSVKVFARVEVKGTDKTNSNHTVVGFKHSFGLSLFLENDAGQQVEIEEVTAAKEANGDAQYTLAAKVINYDRANAKGRNITWSIVEPEGVNSMPMGVTLSGTTHHITTTDDEGRSSIQVAATGAGSVTIQANIEDDESGVLYNELNKVRHIRLKFKKTLSVDSVAPESSDPVEADGHQLHTINAIIKDAEGVVAKGRTVSWLLDNDNNKAGAIFSDGKLEASSRTDDNGQATIYVKATKVGSALVTATIKREGIVTANLPKDHSNSVTVKFKQSYGLLPLQADPPGAVEADNIQTVTLTAKVIGPDKKIREGRNVQWTIDDSENTDAEIVGRSEGTTDSNGEVTFTLKAKKPGRVIVRASTLHDNPTFYDELKTSQDIPVIFKQTVTHVEITPTDKKVVRTADNQDEVLVTAIALDKDKNVVKNATVRWEVVNASGPATPINGLPDVSQKTNEAGVVSLNYKTARSGLIQIRAIVQGHHTKDTRNGLTSVIDFQQYKVLTVTRSGKDVVEADDTDRESVTATVVAVASDNPNNTRVLRDKEVKWAVSPEEQASIVLRDKIKSDDKGEVTVGVKASKAGNVTVQAHVLGEGADQTIKGVTIPFKQSFGVGITDKNLQAVEADGETVATVTARVVTSDGTTVANDRKVSWSIKGDNTIGAQLNHTTSTTENGLATVSVTATKAGSVDVVAAISDEEPGTERGDAYQVELKKADDVTVSFMTKVSKIELRYSKTNLVADKQDSTTFWATALNTRGKPIVGAKVSWDFNITNEKGEVIPSTGQFITSSSDKTAINGAAWAMFQSDQPISITSASATITGLNTDQSKQEETSKLVRFRQYAITSVTQDPDGQVELGGTAIITAFVNTIDRVGGEIKAIAPVKSRKVRFTQNPQTNAVIKFVGDVERTNEKGQVQISVTKKDLGNVNLRLFVDDEEGAAKELDQPVIVVFKETLMLKRLTKKLALIEANDDEIIELKVEVVKLDGNNAGAKRNVAWTIVEKNQTEAVLVDQLKSTVGDGNEVILTTESDGISTVYVKARQGGTVRVKAAARNSVRQFADESVGTSEREHEFVITFTKHVATATTITDIEHQRVRLADREEKVRVTVTAKDTDKRLIVGAPVRWDLSGALADKAVRVPDANDSGDKTDILGQAWVEFVSPVAGDLVITPVVSHINKSGSVDSNSKTVDFKNYKVISLTRDRENAVIEGDGVDGVNLTATVAAVSASGHVDPVYKVIGKRLLWDLPERLRVSPIDKLLTAQTPVWITNDQGQVTARLTGESYGKKTIKVFARDGIGADQEKVDIEVSFKQSLQITKEGTLTKVEADNEAISELKVKVLRSNGEAAGSNRSVRWEITDQRGTGATFVISDSQLQGETETFLTTTDDQGIAKIGVKAIQGGTATVKAYAVNSTFADTRPGPFQIFNVEFKKTAEKVHFTIKDNRRLADGVEKAVIKIRVTDQKNNVVKRANVVWRFAGKGVNPALDNKTGITDNTGQLELEYISTRAGEVTPQVTVTGINGPALENQISKQKITFKNYKVQSVTQLDSNNQPIPAGSMIEVNRPGRDGNVVVKAKLVAVSSDGIVDPTYPVVGKRVTFTSPLDVKAQLDAKITAIDNESDHQGEYRVRVGALKVGRLNVTASVLETGGVTLPNRTAARTTEIAFMKTLLFTPHTFPKAGEYIEASAKTPAILKVQVQGPDDVIETKDYSVTWTINRAENNVEGVLRSGKGNRPTSKDTVINSNGLAEMHVTASKAGTLKVRASVSDILPGPVTNGFSGQPVTAVDSHEFTINFKKTPHSVDIVADKSVGLADGEEEIKLTATVTAEDGSPVSGASINWVKAAAGDIDVKGNEEVSGTHTTNEGTAWIKFKSATHGWLQVNANIKASHETKPTIWNMAEDKKAEFKRYRVNAVTSDDNGEQIEVNNAINVTAKVVAISKDDTVDTSYKVKQKMVEWEVAQRGATATITKINEGKTDKDGIARATITAPERGVVYLKAKLAKATGAVEEGKDYDPILIKRTLFIEKEKEESDEVEANGIAVAQLQVKVTSPDTETRGPEVGRTVVWTIAGQNVPGAQLLQTSNGQAQPTKDGNKPSIKTTSGPDGIATVYIKAVEAGSINVTARIENEVPEVPATGFNKQEKTQSFDVNFKRTVTSAELSFKNNQNFSLADSSESIQVTVVAKDASGRVVKDANVRWITSGTIKDHVVNLNPSTANKTDENGLAITRFNSSHSGDVTIQAVVSSTGPRAALDREQDENSNGLTASFLNYQVQSITRVAGSGLIEVDRERAPSFITVRAQLKAVTATEEVISTYAVKDKGLTWNKTPNDNHLEILPADSNVTTSNEQGYIDFKVKSDEVGQYDLSAQANGTGSVINDELTALATGFKRSMRLEKIDRSDAASTEADGEESAELVVNIFSHNTEAVIREGANRSVVWRIDGTNTIGALLHKEQPEVSEELASSEGVNTITTSDNGGQARVYVTATMNGKLDVEAVIHDQVPDAKTNDFNLRNNQTVRFTVDFKKTVNRDGLTLVPSHFVRLADGQEAVTVTVTVRTGKEKDAEVIPDAVIQWDTTGIDDITIVPGSEKKKTNLDGQASVTYKSNSAGELTIKAFVTGPGADTPTDTLPETVSFRKFKVSDIQRFTAKNIKITDNSPIEINRDVEQNHELIKARLVSVDADGKLDTDYVAKGKRITWVVNPGQTLPTLTALGDGRTDDLGWVTYRISSDTVKKVDLSAKAKALQEGAAETLLDPPLEIEFKRTLWLKPVDFNASNRTEADRKESAALTVALFGKNNTAVAGSGHEVKWEIIGDNTIDAKLHETHLLTGDDSDLTTSTGNDSRTTIYVSALQGGMVRVKATVEDDNPETSQYSDNRPVKTYTFDVQFQKTVDSVRFTTDTDIRLADNTETAVVTLTARDEQQRLIKNANVLWRTETITQRGGIIVVPGENKTNNSGEAKITFKANRALQLTPRATVQSVNYKEVSERDWNHPRQLVDFRAYHIQSISRKPATGYIEADNKNNIVLTAQWRTIVGNTFKTDYVVKEKKVRWSSNLTAGDSTVTIDLGDDSPSDDKGQVKVHVKSSIAQNIIITAAPDASIQHGIAEGKK